jgi:hypothetical protein
MEEIRNLTKEAANLAKKTLAQQYPALEDKTFRCNLSKTDKIKIFQQLNMLAELYLQQLENQIIYG